MDNDGIPYGDIILIIPEGDTSTLHSYLFTIFAPPLVLGRGLWYDVHAVERRS
jgi:hypothetical protein